MKILKVIHGYPPTYNAGSEVYSRNICEQLAKTSEVRVFTREENPYRLDFSVRTEIQNGVPLTLVNLPREKDGYEQPQVNEAFADLIQDFQPDIIHIGHLNHLSIGIVREAKKAKIPVIFTLHDFWLMCPRGQFLQRNFDGKQLHNLCSGQEDKKCALNCYRMLQSCRPEDAEQDTAYWTDWVNRRMVAVRELLPTIDLFLAPSMYLKDRFVHDFGILEERIQYLDYGFSYTHLNFTYQLSPNRPYTFSYIGTHIPSKGINLLIEAFLQIKQSARLLIWGRESGQSTAALKRLTANSQNEILFMGEYENQNIATQVFSETDAIVVPSIWGENSPLVIHEAQACKIPVITADFGGMKEYVQHEINGLLFKHRDTDDLMKTMTFAVSNPKKMYDLGQKGYLFSSDGKIPEIESHCNKLLTFYRSLTNPVTGKI